MILQKEKKNFSQKLKVNDKFLTNPVEIVNNFILHLVYDLKKNNFSFIKKVKDLVILLLTQITINTT